MKKEITINNISAYYSSPDDGKQYPGLVIIEEIWGLNDHIKSVCDRFAAQGFNVLSPELLPKDILNMLTPELQKDLFDLKKRHEIQPKMREAMQPIMQPEYAKETVAKLKQCVDYLLADQHSNGKAAVLGFCFGGSYSFHLAANDPRIRAAVPFYGQALPQKDITKITCPVLAFYGDQDINLMQSLPTLKEQMQKSGKNFEAIVYQNAGHAFFNDTNPLAYRPEAAQDAWNKTLEFLKKNLA